LNCEFRRDGRLAIAIVPARLGSKRFPGKARALIAGASGIPKSLLQRTWEAAHHPDIDRVIVAVDDPELAKNG
jgi:3-deoxy-manno-octulosonate cytidylyltransferase (CMP-KDO synthetase)